LSQSNQVKEFRPEDRRYWPENGISTPGTGRFCGVEVLRFKTSGDFPQQNAISKEQNTFSKVQYAFSNDQNVFSKD